MPNEPNAKDAVPPRPYTCDNCGSAIGHIERLGRVDALVVIVNGRRYIWYGSGSVPCPRCGTCNEWTPGAEYIRRIVRRVREGVSA